MWDYRSRTSHLHISQTLIVMKVKELSNDFRHCDSRPSHPLIAVALKVHKVTIESILKKLKNSQTVISLKGQGQKPKVSQALIRKVVQEVSSNPTTTSEVIFKNSGIQIS